MYNILDEAHTIEWWLLEKYDGCFEVDWMSVWHAILIDPYPPQGVRLESVLFVYEKLCLNLPLEIIFKHFCVEFCHFRDCPESMYMRLSNL